MLREAQKISRPLPLISGEVPRFHGGSLWHISPGHPHVEAPMSIGGTTEEMRDVQPSLFLLGWFRLSHILLFRGGGLVTLGSLFWFNDSRSKICSLLKVRLVIGPLRSSQSLWMTSVRAGPFEAFITRDICLVVPHSIIHSLRCKAATFRCLSVEYLHNVFPYPIEGDCVLESVQLFRAQDTFPIFAKVLHGIPHSN